MARRALVTGATGFVGGRLAAALADRGWAVRCLVRDRSRAQGLADRGFELHEADVLDAEALRGARDGVDIAYYLIHAMGRGTSRGGFEERERQSARNFAEMATREGIARVVYLGGLGDRPGSAHLRSRHRPDVLSYGEMLDRMADALGVRRRPRVPVPLITPWLSSHWIGLVTPVDAGVARPLVEGLSTPTTVTDGSGAELFDVHPMPFMDALHKALDEDHAALAPAG